jgi:hypothetical protein
MIRNMSEFNQALLIANIYRYLLIIAGTFFAFWGYRLFDKGYFEKGGELKVAFGEHHLMLKQVWPGIFFAALGVLAMAIGVFRKIEISVPTAAGSAHLEMKYKPPNDKPCEPTSESEEYEGKGNFSKRKDGTDIVPKSTPQK